MSEQVKAAGDKAWSARLDKSTCVWTEDDARPPDAEKIEEAWGRYFGGQRVPPKGEALESVDEGDWFAHLHAGGRVAVYAYDGAAIHCLDPEECRRLQRGEGVAERVFPPDSVFSADEVEP